MGRQLENMLDSERAARVAAENTLKSLIDERKAREHAETQLAGVVTTLNTALGKSEARPHDSGRHRGMLSGLGGGEDDAKDKGHKSIRTGTFADHRGNLHFRTGAPAE
eukprot:NODE_2365_length_482_cov_473.591224_g1941_i0.p1 GENE.NODE_2365_length_482_cov_473.591224_g1941_i0~~NODE_2365_length_482_cov_473.591224_g1941_i0.p1  ORF type:complete len:116 (+),score=20.93 NODE_2365_length_482_cov_473.591224_g1941_i0:27-350(+)